MHDERCTLIRSIFQSKAKLPISSRGCGAVQEHHTQHTHTHIVLRIYNTSISVVLTDQLQASHRWDGMGWKDDLYIYI